MRVQAPQLKPTQRLVINNFMGVDKASIPSNVALNRATDMSNFIYNDGLVRKRNGFVQKEQIKPIDDVEQKINGIFEYKFNYVEYGLVEKPYTLSVVYAGNKFYAKLQGGEYIDITTTKCIIRDGELVAWGEVAEEYRLKDLTDTPIQAFRQDGKLYFIGMGEFAVLDIYGQGGYIELRKVFGNNATIPTTTTQISAKNGTMDNRQQLDSVNLLTPLKRNTLIGKEIPQDSNIKYVLDSPIVMNKDFSIRITNTGEGDKVIVASNERKGGTSTRQIIVGENLKGKRITISAQEIINRYLYEDPQDAIDLVKFQSKIGVESGNKIYLDFGKPTANNYSVISKQFENSGGQVILVFKTLATFSFASGKWTASTPTLETTFIEQYDNYVSYIDLGLQGAIKGENLSNEEYNLLNEKNEVVGEVSCIKSEITFLNAIGKITPILPEESNIIVTFADSRIITRDGADKIRKAKFGTIFGVNGADDRLFLSDGTNTDVYSEFNDFTYFGSLNTITIGTAPIVGYLRLNDSSLGVLKGDNRQDATMYIRSGRYDNQYNKDGYLIKSTPIFTSVSANTSEQAIGNSCNFVLNNDPMFLAKEGIFGVEMSNNIATNQRLLKLRSNAISKDLKKLDLTQARCIVWQNRAFVFCQGKVFIADPRFKYRLASDITDTFNYEWWIWDTMPISYVTIINDKLIVGDSNGAIYEYGDSGYIDTKYRYLMIATALTNGKVQISPNALDILKEDLKFKIKSPTRLKILGARDYNVNSFGEPNTTTLRITRDVPDFSKLSVKRFTKFCFKGDGWDRVIQGEIRTFGWITIVLQGTPEELGINNNNKKDLYVYADDGDFYVKDLDVKNNTLKIGMLDYNNEISTFSDVVIKAKEPSEPFAIFYKEDIVKAKWFTPVTDLGGCDMLKDLESLTIGVDSTNNAKIDVGYVTRRADYQIIPPNYMWDTDKDDFTFSDIDFLSFSFIPSFDYSITKKVIARNFNYIMLKVESNTAEECALKEIIVKYKFVANTRGVR